MLPVFVDECTTIKIGFPSNLKDIEIKASTTKSEIKKLFLFSNDNPEDFEIIIRKKKS